MNYLKNSKEKVSNWVVKKLLGLFVFNIILMLLVLLRSAGYFDPYFLISINMIVLISVGMLILLLGLRSREIFIVALAFWLFAGVLRSLNLDVWAERTTVYTFQSIFLASLLLVWETIKIKRL